MTMNNFTPDPSTGQILPGSKFGDKLTELAREAKVIVEIGTWKGQGSTLCLFNGIKERPDAFLFTIEAYRAMYEQYVGPVHERVFRIWGTIVIPEDFPSYETTVEQYHLDKNINASAPFVHDIIPQEIDLLLIDGGEWTANVEYHELGWRSKVVALDDTNQDKSIKNYRAVKDMIESGWIVLADEPEDRNGWFIGRRP